MTWISLPRGWLTTMTDWTVRKLIARLGQQAGFAFPVYPHQLRHACGYALAEAGHDTRRDQLWLGHKNITRTVRYTQLSSDASGASGATEINQISA